MRWGTAFDKVKRNKKITALKYDSKAVTYMIRGKMMSEFLSLLSATDLQDIFYHLGKKK